MRYAAHRSAAPSAALIGTAWRALVEAEAEVKPHRPKGRAPARGLDLRLRLHHPFMRAGDAHPKQSGRSKALDSNHGIYRDPARINPQPWRLGIPRRGL